MDFHSVNYKAKAFEIRNLILFFLIALWFVPGDDHAQVFFWVWAARLILFSILMTWIFNNTNGSVLAAILFHGMGNAVDDLIWCCGSSAWHYDAVEILTVLLVVISFEPKNLMIKRPLFSLQKQYQPSP